MIGDELSRLNAQAECLDHISQLKQWLRDHPPEPSTAMGRQARIDREAALRFWIAKSQAGGAR